MEDVRAPCTCGWLEKSAAEPGHPVVFNERLNEFNLAHFPGPGGVVGYSRIHFCPWCGGTTPESKRDAFFAVVTSEEKERLTEAYGSLKRVDEAIARLGPPEQDFPHGFSQTSRATATEPENVSSYRLLRYTKLSETVNVAFVDLGPDRGLRMTLEGKPHNRPGDET